MTLIAANLHTILTNIRHSEVLSHRTQGSVQLLAVSKGQPAQAIEEAYKAGQQAFAESYLQEALPKIEALSKYPLQWHFIGPIQSNKTKGIASHFSWVHGVSRKKIAQQLNTARSETLPPLNCCIQVNLDNEDSKAGIGPGELIELSREILQLPRLRLRGLMIIPKQRDTEQEQYQAFLRLTQLLHSLNSELTLKLDTLSMGMSEDFPAAIRAGSTIVRIGRSIFGPRVTSL